MKLIELLSYYFLILISLFPNLNNWIRRTFFKGASWLLHVEICLCKKIEILIEF